MWCVTRTNVLLHLLALAICFASCYLISVCLLLYGLELTTASRAGMVTSAHVSRA